MYNIEEVTVKLDSSPEDIPCGAGGFRLEKIQKNRGFTV